MTLTGLTALQTEAGRLALAAACTAHPREEDFLHIYETLRKQFDPELAKAAIETAILRHKATDKFPQADRLFFERVALEQATHHLVAKHRAERFRAYGHVLDLGAGLGADTLALAQAGCRVTAVERDPLRAAICRCNLAALGFSAKVLTADMLTASLPTADAAFCDPGRRSGGRRHRTSTAYDPPLTAVLERFPHLPLGFKLAPGISRQEMAAHPGEWEFVSLHGELKESRLWRGALAHGLRRATLLPGGETYAGGAEPLGRVLRDQAEFIFLPDPAITRAGLEESLAADWQLAFFNQHDPILLGDQPVPTPMLRPYRLDAVVPGSLAKLNAALRHRGVGRVTLMNIGSPRKPETVRAALKLKGSDERVLLLTRQNDAAVTIFLKAANFTAASLPRCGEPVN